MTNSRHLRSAANEAQGRSGQNFNHPTRWAVHAGIPHDHGSEGPGDMHGTCGPSTALAHNGPESNQSHSHYHLSLCPVSPMVLRKTQPRKANSFSSRGNFSHTQSFSHFPSISHFSVALLKPASALYSVIFTCRHKTTNPGPLCQIDLWRLLHVQNTQPVEKDPLIHTSLVTWLQTCHHLPGQTCFFPIESLWHFSR